MQERPAQQEVRAEQVLLFHGGSPAFRQPDGQHLPGVVPLVGRLCDVQSLVALEPDQGRAEDGRRHLGELGLPDAGFALEEEGALEAEGQEERRGQPAVGDIAPPREFPGEFGDRREGRRLGC